MAVNEDLEFEGQEAESRGTRGFLTILWQRKALVILPTLLGLLGGLLFHWNRTPVYQSTTQVLVIKKRSDAALPIAGGDPRVAYVDDYMATHLVLLRSPLIIERAVKKKDLAAMKTFESSGDPVGQIVASLTVMRDAKESPSGANNIIHLSFRGPVPEECGKVLAAVVESYQEFLDITYRNVSDETLDLITKARDMLKKDKTISVDKYKKFRDQTPLLWKTKDGSNVQLDRVVDMESKRSALLIRQAELRERVKFLENAVESGKGIEVVQALARNADMKLANPDKALDDQLLPLLLQEQQLLETYGEKHPQVISVRNRIKLIREHYQKSAGGDESVAERSPLQRLLQVTREELRETEAVLLALVAPLEDMKKEARDISNLQIHEDELRREVAHTEKLLDGTIQRLAEISLVRDSGGFKANTLSPAGPGVRVAPSAVQTIAGGLFLGILAGFGLAFLAELTDRSFRHPDEVRRRLGLHILGHIPFLKPDAEASEKVAAGQMFVDPLLYPLHKPKSLEAEAYRAVRTAVYFSSPVEGHPVLQVSSPAKGDGKSLMVSNLALSMAQSGKKVLVIDADCRRPRVHKIFNLSNERGLTTVLSQPMEWKDVIQAAPVEGLWLMPSGPVPPNPAELLSSPRFGSLLEAVRPHFDYVIVDTPPLLAVTDPCVVASHVDGLVLVIRLTRQGRPKAERACEILKSLNVKVLGVVVNGVARHAGAGIYNAEHYDYSESYDQGDDVGKYDADYYEYEEDEAPADKPTSTTESSAVHAS
jgi:capsular exopolysaccharide synthesis family protein